MQEEYLHYLWRMKRLDFSQLILANGSKQPVYVEEVGWYNLDAGPDFFNGTVVVDGLRWSGNIELHIKSSDWYADRKSTRLNSSHVRISYAVFCLKKKNKYTP